jgi:hypothetical protein
MEGIRLRPNEVLLLGTGDVVRRSGRYDSVLILASLNMRFAAKSVLEDGEAT